MFDRTEINNSVCIMEQQQADRTRPGFTWPNGPICLAGEHKHYTIPLDDYLRLVEQVERSIKDNDDASQRLRMMYYGSAVKSTKAFDEFLDSWSGARLTELWFDILRVLAYPISIPQPFIDILETWTSVDLAVFFDTLGTWASAPLTKQDVSQATLDAIMRFGFLDLGPAMGRSLPLIDVGHIWVVLDYVYNGMSLKYRAVAEVAWLLSVRKISLLPLINWAGDLGSWWQRFDRQRNKAKTDAESTGTSWSEPITKKDLKTPLKWLNDAQVTRSSAEDILGDIDGVVLGAEIDRRRPPDPGIEKQTPFAALLKEYYCPLTPPDRKQFHSANRFHLFVRNTQPEIPHDYDQKTGVVSLKPTAKEAIKRMVRSAALMFVVAARRRCSSFNISCVLQLIGEVEAELDSPWGNAMLDEIANRFTSFLTSGLASDDSWALSGWPTAPKALDQYGGSTLHIGSKDTSGAEPVRQLQNRLSELGFTGVGTPDGDFGPKTAMALREFQIAATYDVDYAKTLGPPVVKGVGTAYRRYFGPIHGVLDEATADILNLWYAPEENGRVGPDRILNPLTIHTGTIVDTQPVLNPDSDIWSHNDSAVIKDTNSNSQTALFAVDQLERYTIPSEEQYAGHGNRTVITGRYYSNEKYKFAGPVTDGKSLWNSTAIRMENLIPRSVDYEDEAVRSTYRVLRAVARAECYGHFDSVNCYDNARLSIGIYHWALQGCGVGELAAFIAFYKFRYPDSFQADFGRFGIFPEPLKDLGNPGEDWNMDGAHGQAKLAGRLALYGLHDSAGVVQPYTRLPLGQVENGLPQGISVHDKYLADYLRSWRVVYRVVMALRLSPSLQQVQWDFAVLRLNTLLNKSWMTSVDNGPVIVEGGTERPARFGEVFTSEKAVAALLRWHVICPYRIVEGSVAVEDAVGVFEDVYGNGKVNLSAVAEKELDQAQCELVERLRTRDSELTKSVDTVISYESDAGPLKSTANSFKLFVPTV